MFVSHQTTHLDFIESLTFRIIVHFWKRFRHTMCLKKHIRMNRMRKKINKYWCLELRWYQQTKLTSNQSQTLTSIGKTKQTASYEKRLLQNICASIKWSSLFWCCFPSVFSQLPMRKSLINCQIRVKYCRAAVVIYPVSFKFSYLTL